MASLGPRYLLGLASGLGRDSRKREFVMRIQFRFGRTVALITGIVACMLFVPLALADAGGQTSARAANTGNILAAGGKDALRSLMTRVGLDDRQLDLSDGAGPFNDQASDVFASYIQAESPPSLNGIKGLVVARGDVLTLGWKERDEPFFRSFTYDASTGRWLAFVQSHNQSTARSATGQAVAAVNTSEILNITFSPPSVVSTTTGVKSFTATNGNGSAYFTIPLTKKIAALYVQGSINGVFQVAGVGTSVLVASETPIGAKGTVPVLVVYSDAACP
jgi:hypothetical protein